VSRNALALRFVFGFTLVALAFTFPLRVAADTLVTQSGGRFEGVVSEEDDGYVLTTSNGGKMRFARDAVKRVTKSEPAKAPAEPTKAKPAEASGTSEGPNVSTPYLEIPIVGVIGKDLTADGVEKVLAWAAQGNAIKHIVFRIKSPGGYVDEADKIADAIRMYPKLSYHAHIQDATSAAIWIAFSCDTIHMEPGSTLGAAVPFRRTSTGSAAVDAKMCSFYAAKMASLAEKHGYSGVLPRAMVQLSDEAYAWRSADGKVTIADARPLGVADTSFIVKDTPETVLTLTMEQAVACGIAKDGTGGIAAIGPSLGLPGWKKLSDYGENVVARTKANKDKEEAKLQAAIKQNVERTRASVLFIKQNQNEALQNDPGNFTYAYDITTGLYTSDSMARWQAQTDRAMAAWQRVKSGAVTLRDLEKEAPKLGLEPVTHDLNLAQLFDEASRAIARLSADRRRTGP